MTDPDENYFVLLGGQDGWFNSTTILDQWELWRRGDYVRVPLTLDGGARELPARALADELTARRKRPQRDHVRRDLDAAALCPAAPATA